MKNLIQAAVITLLAASAAQAQQAVQWKVSDGGNGHWYQRLSELLTWPEAKLHCEALGGHLATPTSPGENNLVGSLNVPGPSPNSWIGGFQDPAAPDFAEPAGGWRWITGEAWAFTAWYPGECCGPEPNNLGPYPENFLCTWVGGNTWNDLAGGIFPGQKGYPSIIEWSADCNGDGIVDYGQCRNGTLPDYNGNNVPDCCETGTPCAVGNYPVQWRTTEGGNGHWYRTAKQSLPISWTEARIAAERAGGYLATLTTAAENLWVFSSSARDSGAWLCDLDCYGPWLGGFQQPGSCEPGCGWRWVTDEPWSFTAWAPGLPNNAGAQDWLHYYGSPELDGPLNPGPRWDDVEVDWFMIRGFVTEWSADCNDDDIVDKGQILLGQFPDVNLNGVPDGCECAAFPGLPACCLGDLNQDGAVDGADLGTLLNSWGACPGTCPADFDRNGFVDGADLGALLGRWGPCGN